MEQRLRWLTWLLPLLLVSWQSTEALFVENCLRFPTRPLLGFYFPSPLVRKNRFVFLSSSLFSFSSYLSFFVFSFLPGHFLWQASPLPGQGVWESKKKKQVTHHVVSQLLYPLAGTRSSFQLSDLSYCCL